MIGRRQHGPVVIIGGGIIGCLTAWFLRETGHDGSITIVERDSSYRFASTALSAASIRTQFGCPINVALSLFGVTFLRDVKRLLDADAEIGFVEGGYLILGSAHAAEQRHEALAMQRALGAAVDLLDPDLIAARFPWLNPVGLSLATLGTSGEGWFDAWALLQAARRAAIRRDVTFVQDEANGVNISGDRITAVRTASGATLPATWCVNAAGALSGLVAEWLGFTIPVVPKKRTVFNFKAPLEGRGMPMLFDVSGAWMRPEGEGFIGGIQPDAANDPDAHGDFEPDHDLFEQTLWPLLAERVPQLEELRLVSAWAGHYEMNMFDHNGIVGPHPELDSFLFATGFSGHGVMHAPGVARAVAERIVHGHYVTLDATPLGFARIRENRPMPENAIY